MIFETVSLTKYQSTMFRKFFNKLVGTETQTNPTDCDMYTVTCFELTQEELLETEKIETAAQLY